MQSTRKDEAFAMNLTTGSLILLAIVLAGGCSQQETGTGKENAPESNAETASKHVIDPLPPLDVQSPDRLIQSYWAVNDWLNANHCKLFRVVAPNDSEVRDFEEALAVIGAGDYLASQRKQVEQSRKPCAGESAYSYQRDIIEVKPESETRSVVLAKIKNVTPIPVGMTLQRSDLAQRNYGEDVKYVVEKTADGWRLTQAWARGLDIISALRGGDRTEEWEKVWNVDDEKDVAKMFAYEFYTVRP